MKKFKFIRVISALLVGAVLISAGSIFAGAAVIDDGGAVAAGSETSNSDIYENTSESELPSYYSSVDNGYVTSVKSQRYNDCWVYAALGTLESKLLTLGYEDVNMNASHLNAWATTRSNSTGWIRDISGGGFTKIAIGYFTSWCGGVLNSDCNAQNYYDVSGDLVPTDLAGYRVTEIEYLSKEDSEAIKRAVMEDGGVYTSYGIYSSCYNNDKTAYYLPADVNVSFTGHSIEVVGWDDDYATSNFTTSYGIRPRYPGAWLCKNSHGDNNPLGGYFWISYYDKYIFSDYFYPSYSINSVEEIDDTKKMLQNEIYGATYEFGYITSSNNTYANRFEYDDEYKIVDKVVFETVALGANYTVYFIPDDANGAPDSDKSKWTRLYNGTVTHKGYICADVKNFYVPDKSGSIAVNIDTSALNEGISSGSSDYTIASIGVGEWLNKSSTGDYAFLNDSKPKQSYIIDESGSTDILDFYKDELGDEQGGTIVIKAIMTNQRDFKVGDINKDGVMNISDVTMLQKYLAYLESFDEYTAELADYNGDSIISIADATTMQKTLAGLE